MRFLTEGMESALSVIFIGEEMELKDFNKIRKIALQAGFKRNATDQWFFRKSIPKPAQIEIFRESQGSISFERMESIRGKKREETD